MALPELPGEGGGGLGYVFGGLVAHDENLCLQACPLGGPGAVVLAVGTGEDGDQHLGFCRADPRGGTGEGGAVQDRGLALHAGAVGINVLQDGFVQGQQLVNGGGILADYNHGLRCGDADALGAGEINFFRQFRHNGSPIQAVPAVRDGGAGGKADPVAEGHVHDRFRRAVLHRPGGLYLAALGQFMERRPGGFQILRVAAAEAVHRVSRLLELRRDNFPRLNGGDSEGDQGRGDIQVQEGAGHGVLAADGRRAEVHLGLHGPQEGHKGLAPAVRVAPQLLEVFL